MLRNKWLIHTLKNQHMKSSLYTSLNKYRFGVLSFNHMRMCSKFYRKITPEVMKKLYWYESHYEQDPTNQKVAYKYFRELNRYGKHQTVIRLYNRYYDEYDKRISGSTNLRDKIKEQFEYAEDTLYSVKRAVEENDEEIMRK